MTNRLRIAVAQLNPVMGDIAGNAGKVRTARRQASDQSADLVVFTELFITGYPPEDLVMMPALQHAARNAVEALAAETADGGPAILIGTPWAEDDRLYNAVALLDEGDVQAVRHKVDLPNYGPFDEKRVFTPGPLPGPMNIRGVRVGVPICEDIWTDEICECLEETGAELMIVPNGSPFWIGKQDMRLSVAVARVTETGLPLVYANQVGGQDELVFDGGSFALNADRSLALQMPAWEETVKTTEWLRQDRTWACPQGPVSPVEDGLEALYLACVTGLRDYVEKNSFPGIVLGLSGGIDSAVCAAMAVDAIGPDRVHCVMLPYHFTSAESLSDAAACAAALGVRYDVVEIKEPVAGFASALYPLFNGLPSDTAEENIQARVRGTLLMAISNKFGPMLVTTGNKSEVSVGYATLYGDMNGGFNPIKDLYKTQVYASANFRNQHLPKSCRGAPGRVIPENIISRAPSAELRDEQTDQDSLPPYDVLDDILESLIESELSIAETVARGHETETVERIQHLLHGAEYKRRQAAPGVKVSRRNFGRDRRFPITNRFRDRLQ